MLDWSAYLRGRLGDLPLPEDQRDELVEELARHLESIHIALLSRGVLEKDAVRQTEEQVPDWQEFRRDIVRAKRREGVVKERVKQIWAPATVTFLLSFAVLAGFQWLALKLNGAHRGEPRGVILYFPWLLTLPPIGALAGRLSRRACGTGWRLYVSALFSPLVIGLIFLLMFSIARIMGPRFMPDFPALSLLRLALGWVVLPGVALSFGVALQNLREAKAATV